MDRNLTFKDMDGNFLVNKKCKICNIPWWHSDKDVMSCVRLIKL